MKILQGKIATRVQVAGPICKLTCSTISYVSSGALTVVDDGRLSAFSIIIQWLSFWHSQDESVHRRPRYLGYRKTSESAQWLLLTLISPGA